MANIAVPDRNLTTRDMELKAAADMVPKNLPFTQEEWAEMPKEERFIALQFFRAETIASTNGIKFDFPRMKFPTSGSSFWEIETPEGEIKTVKELKGVVVFQLPSRVYYPITDNPTTGTPPTCVSDDGKYPHPEKSQVVQATSCAECSHSQWNTGKDGRGMACKQRTRIFTFLENDGIVDEIPTMISLPPTGVRPFADYVMRLIQRNIPAGLHGVMTAFGLVDETNAGGQKFKKLDCKVSRKLTYPEMQHFNNLSEMFKEKMAEMGQSGSVIDGEF